MRSSKKRWSGVDFRWSGAELVEVFGYFFWSGVKFGGAECSQTGRKCVHYGLITELHLNTLTFLNGYISNKISHVTNRAIKRIII
jgi:hypothetical protein